MKPPLPNKRPTPTAGEQPAQAPAPLREGFLVAEKYGLIEPLGTGSMGAVWKARHVMLGNMVAIKFLHASVDAYPEGRLRFEREAKLSARLGEASRHICRVTDFGVIGSGTPFVVMELLQGEELSTRIKREKQLPVPLIVEIVAQLCRALTVAHEAGVIHRDLKPANVFLCNSEDGEQVFVKLLDFGVAKAALEHEDTQGTRAGTIFGTPGYMSPEQIVADHELDPRSDLWSVAVMVYRMATGRTPFGSGNLGELGLRILSTNPPPPSSVRPDLSRHFDEWMRKGLSKKREDRFATASELSAALVQATGARTSTPPPEEVATISEILTDAEDKTSEPVARSARAPLVQPARSRRLWPVLAAAIAVTGSGFLAVTALGKREAPAPPPVMAAPPRAEPEPAAPPPVKVAAAPTPAASVAEKLPPPGDSAEPAPSAAPAASAQPRRERERDRDRDRAARPEKSTPRPGTVAKRAGELWNKKDEL
jgi:eukaryotic-like serine/threonine-protein kinase